jgi:putative ABC transport system substrate-binding protein
VTGVSSQTTDLSGKRLELLREIVPGLRRLAIVANDDNPASIEEMHQLQKIARADGLDVLTYEIRRTEDIEPVFASLRGSADALYVTSDALMGYNRVRINTFALVAQLPTMYWGAGIRGGSWIGFIRGRFSGYVPTGWRLR